MKINELNKHFNEEVEISAFVDNVRNLQWVQFIILRDKTGKVQLTIEKSEESNKGLVEIVNNLSFALIFFYSLMLKICIIIAYFFQ